MPTLKIGKFEVGQQNGQAGTHVIGVKYVEQHTGRGTYMKQLRANAGTASAISTYEIEGRPPFFTLDTEIIEITYDIIHATINGISNAEKFRISTVEGKTITLKPNTGYTVSQNEGVFTEGFGINSQGAVAILVEFSINATTNTLEYPISIEIWNGVEWVNVGTCTIKQYSSDASVNFAIVPSTLPTFTKDGGTKTITVNSNIGFNIVKQGGKETSWVTLDKNNGNVGSTEVSITVIGQEVGSPERNLSLVFRNQLSNSVIGTLVISQEQGSAYSVNWEHESINFENTELNTIKNNNLTANANWYLEEVV